MSLILHRGAVEASRENLNDVPIPKQTKSYCPVAHGDLADLLVEAGKSYLSEFSFHKSQFGLNREGRQLFGLHTFRNGSTELGLSIGFRNSYDRSLSVGVAVGASVLVCDNLALTGDVTVLRRHTRNVLDDLEEMVVTTVLKARSAFYSVRDEANQMKAASLHDDSAYRIMGLLYGRKVISLRQLSVVKQEWHQPSHSEFQQRNQWSFYNAVTEALKSTPPRAILERHLQLNHVLAENGWEDRA